MKYLLLLPALMLLAACSRTSESTDTTVMEIDSETAVMPVPIAEEEPADTVAADTELTDEQLCKLVEKMFVAMPDHGDYSPDSRRYMTREFYSATVRGFDAPGNLPGGIGDEEELYYWTSAGEECPGRVVKVELSNRSADKAEADVEYASECDGNHTFHLKLAKEDDMWRVADFNGMLSLFKNFNRQMKREYAGDGPMAILEREGIDPEEETAKEFLRQVNNYKRKYGIK